MERYRKLTLLHSNDLHGDFLAETVDEQLTGGVSMLSGYVEKVRSEQPNTLYCIAGDMLRGSVIDSEYKGLSTIEIMNAIAPDVATLGNHETDYGIAHLLFLEKCAKFPIINANLYIKSNSMRLFRSHVVLETGGMKVLFIGIITDAVMASAKNDGLVGSFVDIHEAANEVTRICDAYNAADIDLTVLLTHIGFEEDKQLAALLNPACGVDIIVGGHSHTTITEPAVVNGIAIVQAGVGTDQIGRFDLTIDTEQNCVADYSWQSVAITPETCPHDPAIDRILAPYTDATDRIYSRPITRLRRELTHPTRYRETELGDLFADILAESLALDVMFLGSGSIRTDALGPLVLFSDLTECFPYDEEVRMLTVTGAQLRRMVEFAVRKEVWQGGRTSFFQISGGLHIHRDFVNEKLEISLHGAPICDEKLYRVGVQKYHRGNFERYFGFPIDEIEQARPSKVLATSIRGVIEEYLSCHNNMDKTTDGRVTLIFE
ncbi:MAG: bifunctional metallophosphatase/5'-nucleotidase [Oscillospiraceae bacterium]|nr:bifunctional metallophosphatase/5'-nucleotidase [Oscillospiraceae bacterium]